MVSFTFEQMSIGDKAEMSKTISERDVQLFAEVTNDRNPAHLDEEYASATSFKACIVHGALLGGLISAVLGNHLPGHGTIFVKQTTKFLAPVYFGETITARVEITELKEDKKWVVLRTWCENQVGEPVVDGEALVSAPRR